MSKCRDIELECSHCDGKSNFTVWDSINVDLNPELRDKLFSGELFVWKCPECGEYRFALYPTLYHDMKNRFMIFFDPDEEADYKYTPFKMPLPEGMEDYTVRRVFGYMNFKEKIVMLEDGVNDIAIERFKFFLTHASLPELQGKTLYFGRVNREDKKWSEYGAFDLFFNDEESGEIAGAHGFDMTLYFEALLATQLDHRMQLGDHLVVDQQWMAKQLECNMFNAPSKNDRIAIDKDYEKPKPDEKGVWYNNGWALIDKDGIAVTPHKYWGLKSAGEGYWRAMVTGGCKFKLLSPDGTEITKEMYQTVGTVHNGFFSVGNTIRKTKTTPTQYPCGLAHVRGFMAFSMDSGWRAIRPITEKNEDGSESLVGFSAQKDGKPYYLTPFGTVYDPQKSHLPAKKSVEVGTFMEKFLNWTLPGLQFFYRDSDSPVNVKDLYHEGQTLRAGFFVDMSTKLLRPLQKTRFLIASAHAAIFSQIDEFAGLGTEVGSWGLAVIHPNSYLKVLDIYEKDGFTQVLMLHIPEAAARLLTDSKLEFLADVLPDGKSLIEIARESLDEKLKDEIHPRSFDSKLVERMTAFPGYDEHYNQYALEPVPEEYFEAKPYSKLVHEIAQDDDITDFVETEDLFPWQGVEGSCCQGCIYASTIIGKGEGCKMMSKESFRTQYTKGGLCDEMKKEGQAQSLREYRDAMSQIEKDKATDTFALQLAQDFIELELDGNINRLLDYEFKFTSSYDKFPEKVEVKYGKARYPRGVTSKEALAALLSLIFSDAWPEMTLNDVDKYFYGVDQVHQSFPLLGSVVGLDMEGVTPRFLGLNRWMPPTELKGKVVGFCHKERTLGNMILWPTPLTYQSITNALTRAKRLWADYPDHYLTQLRRALLGDKNANKELVRIINDKRCKKLLAKYQSEAAFRYIMAELCLNDYLDNNGQVKEVFDLIRFDTKDVDRERLFSGINRYIDTAVAIIEKRGQEMLTTLKYKLHKNKQ